MRRQKSKIKIGRIRFFGICLILTGSLVSYRLFRLTFIQHESFAKAAMQQQVNATKIFEGRGAIYGFDLSRDESKLLVSNQRTDKGIERYYPKGRSTAHVLGFVGFLGNQRVGQYGVEAYYDEILSGLTKTQSLGSSPTYARFRQLKSIFLNEKEQNGSIEVQSLKRDGEDLVLTIDPNIQSYVEARLGEVLKKYSSRKGQIIVQDPSSGAILAMAASPSFDPNTYGKSSFAEFLNPNVQEQFEPGSTFKAITMAGAIDAGVLNPETTYTDTGIVQIGKYAIRNYNDESNGVQTMREVLEKSLNTGIVFAERRLGDDKFLNYVVAFGFGQKAGIDLAGEVSGNIQNLYENHAVNFATAAFGQGIAVTPLQLVNAYSAIANGGKLMRPYVVKEIVHADGSRSPTKPEIIGVPIRESTSSTIKSMLVDVVDKGFDKAQVVGYDVAGKTGTAQIPDGKGGYLEQKQYIHDFVGFAPAYAPRFTVLIRMDRPQGITFASRSLSPVFGDIAQFLLRYLNIPPTRT